MDKANTTIIAALNDHARQSFRGCRVKITQGIQTLEDVNTVLRQVQQFDAFTTSVESRWCALPHC